MSQFETLKQKLSEVCTACETGTLCITTEENKACYLLVEKGVVTALTYSKYRGEEVVEQLTKINIRRFSFLEDIKMPLAGRSFVDDDYDVLTALGLGRPAEDTAPLEAKKPQTRMYRGHPVYVEPSPVKTTAKKTKSVRMYRGHVIQDA